jgi:hypothetical protein
MILKNNTVEMRAYSTSWVAVKEIRTTDKNLTTLFSNILETFSGNSKALCEKSPWYNMISENNTGCDLITLSVLELNGPRKDVIFFINLTQDIFR